MSLTEKIIAKIIQSYLRENVSNYLEGVGDALAKELVSKGATLNGIGMKYFLDDKEITLAELNTAPENLDPGNEHNSYTETIELVEIKNGAMYFEKSGCSWY